jgi:mannose-6-phosphate isomerase-like protein (cupin superfamily)
MHVSTTASAPKRSLPGLLSVALLQEGDVSEADLTVTWVDVEPGSRQLPHSHPPQQVYLIVRGTGRMQVGDERREVRAGDLVFIPPGATHGIENTGGETLSYLSAATPAFRVTDLYDEGDLSSGG